MSLSNAVRSPSTSANGCTTKVEANNYETRGHCRQLVTSVNGSPLSSYRSELQLLKGLRSCLQVHRILSEQGILHEDISRETVLLCNGAGTHEDTDGVLLDNDDARPLAERAMTTHLASSNRRGSSQYMATEVLSGVIYEHVAVTRTLSHDVESFVWLLDCVMMKRMLRTVSTELEEETCQNQTHTRNDEDEANQKFLRWKNRFLKQSFKDVFSQEKIEQILNMRKALKPSDWLVETNFGLKIRRAFSAPLTRLIWTLMGDGIYAELERVAQREWRRRGPGPDWVEHSLMHNVVLTVLDSAIKELQELENSQAGRCDDERAGHAHVDLEE